MEVEQSSAEEYEQDKVIFPASTSAVGNTPILTNIKPTIILFLRYRY